MEDSTHMRVRCVDSQRNTCPRYRVSDDWNRGKEELGGRESGV